MESTKVTAALVCTTIISLLPNVLLLLFPNFASDSPILTIGQALAAGGLLGDVFLHTLPHVMLDNKNDHGESIGIAILTGFLVFFLFDILVRSFGAHDHVHDEHHQHCHNGEAEIQGEGGHTKKKSVFSSEVILNVVADSLHNFTDGIAIGASFAGTKSIVLDQSHSSSFLSQVMLLIQSRGGLASLAVLFHEIPHELGDFAILVSAGIAKNRAIMIQFSTAIAAYCGTLVGLFGMEQLKGIIGYDFMTPFTSGGFLYLAAVTILPSLLQENTKFSLRIAQFMAFVVGIAFMYLVAVIEEEEGHHHGHSHSGHDHDHGHHDHHQHLEHHNHHHEHNRHHDEF
mmetsp:Transcript_17777/g.20247  ORF Transcript_17777/g.20247 Transcript_17777/m.20247 type:complete len:342 (+) Transcript_17777:192-1217(+)